MLPVLQTQAFIHISLTTLSRHSPFLIRSHSPFLPCCIVTYEIRKPSNRMSKSLCLMVFKSTYVKLKSEYVMN